MGTRRPLPRALSRASSVTLLAPSSGARPAPARPLIAALFIISALTFTVAPRFMTVDYTWIANTTSESAAQGVEYAWISRIGFITFGLAVLWLASIRRQRWARLARWLHVVFGVSMVATASFSSRSWRSADPFDPLEDALHSFTATTMGFAFALGVAACLVQRWRDDKPGRLFDAVAILAATALPLVMFAMPDYDGLFQRVMFAVAYAWYLRAAWTA